MIANCPMDMNLAYTLTIRKGANNSNQLVQVTEWHLQVLTVWRVVPRKKGQHWSMNRLWEQDQEGQEQPGSPASHVVKRGTILINA
jgi:hypothetical protein